jgi:hypothetical protein
VVVTLKNWLLSFEEAKTTKELNRSLARAHSISTSPLMATKMMNTLSNKLTAHALQPSTVRKILMLSVAAASSVNPECIRKIINWACGMFLSKSANPNSRLFATCKHVLQYFSAHELYSDMAAVELSSHHTSSHHLESEVNAALLEWTTQAVQRGSASEWHQLNVLFGLPGQPKVRTVGHLTALILGVRSVERPNGTSFGTVTDLLRDGSPRHIPLLKLSSKLARLTCACFWKRKLVSQNYWHYLGSLQC